MEIDWIMTDDFLLRPDQNALASEVSLYVQGDIRTEFVITRQMDEWVVIEDLGRPETRSVTNAAELVVEWLNKLFPGRRILYKDTDGSWAELKHEGGRFVGFRLAPPCFKFDEGEEG